MTSPPLDPQPQPHPHPQPKQEDDEMLVPNTDLLEGPQPMSVAQAETTSTVEAQAVNDLSSVRFTWTIDNFSRRNRKRLYSDVFFVGGYKWRILLFPKGNNVNHLSMYLGVADSTNLPYGWSRYAQFSLSVINQIHNKYSIRKETQGQFNARERDWGFTSFMPLGELYDPGRGYLVNNTCIVEAAVAESVPRAQTKTKDFRDGDRLEGAKELFNYRHSSLHNVIERCFGVLKARFPILKMIPRYKPCRQGNVMRACCTSHNFVRIATRNDRLFTQFNIDNLTIEGEGRNNSGEPFHTVDLTDQAAEAMANYRDQIARLMLANNRHR
ncbi:hypothetical protein CMV_007678 [Castanea mollissima]|uniref:MATH domain-containing protein n=1 Tax=Castanea mollissima TaxID=60419 RepID=A0A8J4RUN6_9ROSI|nr:hypothetical protein CMV_007678 [Castanea mollissima]